MLEFAPKSALIRQRSLVQVQARPPLQTPEFGGLAILGPGWGTSGGPPHGGPPHGGPDRPAGCSHLLVIELAELRRGEEIEIAGGSVVVRRVR